MMKDKNDSRKTRTQSDESFGANIFCMLAIANLLEFVRISGRQEIKKTLYNEGMKTVIEISGIWTLLFIERKQKCGKNARCETLGLDPFDEAVYSR